jgi:hypothetical protein
MYMKLSDAIMLGAPITTAMPYHLDNCAFGMALNAVGVPKCVELFATGSNRQTELMARWPWLGSWESEQWKDIVHMFNEDVCCDRSMTLEQLVDYVRAIEPACECNRFDCDCSPKQAEEVQAEYVTQA